MEATREDRRGQNTEAIREGQRERPKPIWRVRNLVRKRANSKRSKSRSERPGTSFHLEIDGGPKYGGCKRGPERPKYRGHKRSMI